MGRTSGGRHSSAWRRSTEKPPCVLVSEAVNVLQNECTRGLTCPAAGAEGTSSSVEPLSSCFYTTDQHFFSFQNAQNFYPGMYEAVTACKLETFFFYLQFRKQSELSINLVGVWLGLQTELYVNHTYNQE